MSRNSPWSVLAAILLLQTQDKYWHSVSAGFLCLCKALFLIHFSAGQMFSHLCVNLQTGDLTGKVASACCCFPSFWCVCSVCVFVWVSLHFTWMSTLLGLQWLDTEVEPPNTVLFFWILFLLHPTVTPDIQCVRTVWQRKGWLCSFCLSTWYIGVPSSSCILIFPVCRDVRML